MPLDTLETGAVEPLEIERDISTENPVLVVKAFAVTATRGSAVQTVYGRRQYVPYWGYEWLIKPIGAATVVLPFWLSARDPHAHGARPWGVGDYWRDVAAWYNPISGMPLGRRRADAEESVAATRTVTVVMEEKRVPAAGRRIVLALDGAERAALRSDSAGRAAFDLSAILTVNDAQSDRRISVRLDEPGEDSVPLRWTVSSGLLRALVPGTGE